jgi:hypothetical protein
MEGAGRTSLLDLQGPDLDMGNIESVLIPLEEPRLSVNATDGRLKTFSVMSLPSNGGTALANSQGGSESEVSEDEAEEEPEGEMKVVPELPDPLSEDLEMYRGLKTIYHFSEVLLSSTLLDENEQPPMSVQHLLDCLDEVHTKYIKHLPRDSNPQTVYRLLGFNPVNFITAMQLDERKVRVDTLVLGLLNHCRARRIIKPSEVGGTLLEGRINRVRENISVLCQSLQVHQRMVQGSNVNIAAQAGALLDLVEANTYADAKNTELVILHMLRVSQVCSYCKMDEYVYEQITTNYVDKRGNPKTYFTRAWNPVCDMTEFVHRNVRKEQVYDVWSALVSGAGTVKKVVDYLTNCYDSEIPRLKLNRRVFAFKNGLYFADQLKFKSYEDIQSGREHVEASVVACKFFDRVFYDYLGLPVELHHVTYWWDIPTPAFESILRDQHLGADYDVNIKRGEPGYSLEEEQKVHHWIYALLGRLQYKVGELDNWQVILFIHGKANTGKSTIANMIQKLYLKQNIGVLSNNIETKFGLSGLLNKFFYICYELKNDFSLDQSEFQSMVSGEDMSVAVKGKTAVTVKWTQPGLFLGNTYASTWLDNSGSIARRLVIVDFFQEIAASDPQLDHKLEQEMPQMIQKMNMAYLYMVAKYGRRGIWDKTSAHGEQVLPDYFHLTQKRMLTSTHPLRLFIHTLMSDFFTLDSSGYVPFNDFFRRFKEKTPNFDRQRIVWNPEYYRSPFSAYGLTVVPPETRRWEGEDRHETWLQGLSVVKH